MTKTYLDFRFTDANARRRFGSIAAALGLLILFGAGTTAFAERQPATSPPIQAFEAATREYAALHRRLEATLPALEVTSNPDTIFRLVQQMAAAVRNARPDATVGEFFTDAVAVELRARIADALANNGFTPDDVRMSEAADGINPETAPLIANGRFPWRYASAMFPCVLEALPPLPPELQYRVIGSTLILVDVHADLIVDLLPYALADTER